MIDKKKIAGINAVIREWFGNHSVDKIAAKELMPQFIATGIFTADHRNGLPIRNLLRELDRNNQLNLIPYVLADRKKINTNWFFVRQTEDDYLILSPAIVSKKKFVKFWSEQYADLNEKTYYRNIYEPLTRNNIRALFQWKNGGNLSIKKAYSVQKNYTVKNVPSLESLKNTQILKSFLSHAGGAIWRIFWLHCNYPRVFPIYDQHVHRAMATIKGFPEIEIPKTNRDKVEFYINHYLAFYHCLDANYEDHRKVDKALWAFGKFIKSHYSLFKD